MITISILQISTKQFYRSSRPTTFIAPITGNDSEVDLSDDDDVADPDFILETEPSIPNDVDNDEPSAPSQKRAKRKNTSKSKYYLKQVIYNIYYEILFYNKNKIAHSIF